MSTYKDLYTVEEFDEAFDPLWEPDDEQLWQFDSYDDAIIEARKFDTTNPYRHIWTVVDGDSGEQLIVINGYHLVNRLFYLVCKHPWGTGEESDKDIYIEAEY